MVNECMKKEYIKSKMGAILENINYKITLSTLTFYIDKIRSFQ